MTMSGGIMISLWGCALLFATLRAQGAQEPDISRNPCASFQCENGGSCIAPLDVPMCLCHPGFSGEMCTIPFGDVPITPSVENVQTLCAATTCLSGTECRVVIPCQDCKPQAGCFDIQGGADGECRSAMYTQTILGVTGDQIDGPISCDQDPFGNRTCPFGSVCIGAGVCCTGKPSEKAGFCPSGRVCGGLSCDFDNDCPGDQKCCDGCGKVCTAPVSGPDCGGCPSGETCTLRPEPCPVDNIFCPEKLVPACVPDACKDCRSDQECRQLPNTIPCPQDAPCPEFTYICALRGYAECSDDEPCPRGELCLTLQICESEQVVTEPGPFGTTQGLFDTPGTTQSAPLPPSRRTEIPTRKFPPGGVTPATVTQSILFDPFCAEVRECFPSSTPPVLHTWEPTTSIPATETLDLGCEPCDDGEVCVLRSRDCPVGLFCAQDLVPQCVPEACKDCSPDQECRQLPNVCPMNEKFMEPCPEFRYICALKGTDQCGDFLPCPAGSTCTGTSVVCADGPARGPQSGGMELMEKDIMFDPYCDTVRTCLKEADMCGGCSSGQKCVPTVVCFRAPCPTEYHCIPDDPCNGCPKGKVCELFHPPCTKSGNSFFSPECNATPIPICVNENTSQTVTNPPEEPICNKRCPPGTECQITKRSRPCRPHTLCDHTKIQTCVPTRRPVCPPIPLDTNPFTCMLLSFRTGCAGDRECPNGEICCPTTCKLMRNNICTKEY